MMPPGFNMDAAALQHMLSTYYGALPVPGGPMGPPHDGSMATQESIEATARALLSSMPPDNATLQSQLADIMAHSVDDQSADHDGQIEGAEPDVQRVRDFFATQLAAIKQATGFQFPDEVGQSALDVIAAMAKSVHSSERSMGKKGWRLVKRELVHVCLCAVCLLYKLDFSCLSARACHACLLLAHVRTLFPSDSQTASLLHHPQRRCQTQEGQAWR